MLCLIYDCKIIKQYKRLLLNGVFKYEKFYFCDVLFLTIILFLFLSTNAQEVPASNTYIVLKNIENIEIREYRPLLFASYVNSNSGNTENSSFRILADYIFGSNQNNEEIAMTSPVVINLFNDNEMMFRMPEKYNIQNIPKPNNKDVKFIETRYTQKAVIQYSGFSNAEKESKKIEELKIILDKYGIQHDGNFELLIYDAPYKFFNRRNEIAVNILK